MKKSVLLAIMTFSAICMYGQELNPVPRAWKWTSPKEVVFTYDGTYTDSCAFKVDVRNGKKVIGVQAPEKFADFPVKPEMAVNLTYSPDSTKLAFTRDNDLYVVDIASGEETRLTYDGTDLIMNGYSSWVYYEEILGRPTKYKAFWWSPDSRKIGFYRFDNTEVPLFPIYSAFADPEGAASQSQSPRITDLGIGGSLSETRYPKCGQTNPQVRIGIVEIADQAGNDVLHSDNAVMPDSIGHIVWADFDPTQDQYFGIPFWGPDSKEFFIARMPRLQNTIDLYAVNAEDGSKRHVYNETYKTWLNWFEGVVFTDKGLYMAREFETGWQQIYFLSYDGKEFRRLTDGTNWSVNILKVDEKNGVVYYTAKRDASVRQAVYKVDWKGVITALTDPVYNVENVRFSPDGKYFAASYSNTKTPTRVAIFSTSEGVVSKGHGGDIASANLLPAVEQKLKKGQFGLQGRVVVDSKGKDFDPTAYSLGQLVHMTTPDGLTLPGMITYPKGFDAAKKYPVHVEIYGGPDAPSVHDRWTSNLRNQWYADNGIIHITIDPRAGGHNGRYGLDMIYRQLTVNEVKDFCSWADWLMELPYVQDEKIGVEGFSFGGTMTCMLLMQAPDKFHYGIAGGGVYDWALYDSHYTERYMDTPQANPEGYEVSKVLNYVDGYPTEYDSDVVRASGAYTYAPAERAAQHQKEYPEHILEVLPGCAEPVMLKLTHGTGDDNVHHQNTLQLLNEIQREGKKVELMIYPDGMHGYRGYQGEHFNAANREFWLKYLLR